MNFSQGDSPPGLGGHTHSLLPDGMTSALGWVGFGLIVFMFIYLLISAAMRTGKRGQSPPAGGQSVPSLGQPAPGPRSTRKKSAKTY